MLNPLFMKYAKPIIQTIRHKYSTEYVYIKLDQIEMGREGRGTPTVRVRG